MLTASFTARDPFETFSPTLLDHQAANAMDARWDSEAEHLECRQSSARSAPFGSIVTITMASMTPLVADLGQASDWVLVRAYGREPMRSR